MTVGVFPPNVVSGQPIASSWGNAVADNLPFVVRFFPTIAARDAASIPSDGIRCYVAENKREYLRVAGAWQSVPIVIAGTVAVTGDGAGNGAVPFARAFPATPNIVQLDVVEYGNVAGIPFNILPTQCGVGLRRPSDNSPVGGIALTVSYIATLL